LLLANPLLVAVSVKFGVDKLRYMDEFDTWVDMVGECVSDAEMVEMFYCYKL